MLIYKLKGTAAARGDGLRESDGIERLCSAKQGRKNEMAGGGGTKTEV